jgi:hypothetical protein
MTTGQRLVDISTLTTGTALDHFLNISTGGGQTEYVYFDSSLKIELMEEETKVNISCDEPLYAVMIDDDETIKIKNRDINIKIISDE